MWRTPTLQRNLRFGLGSKAPERDHVGLINYRKRAVDVESLFTRSKRILHEHLRRFEEEMFLIPKGETAPRWSSAQAKLAKDLSGAVTSLGQMFLKIEEKARAATDAMTTDEKVAVVCQMIREEGRRNQQKFLRALRELDYELSHSKPKKQTETDTTDSASEAEPGNDPVPGR